MWLESLTLEHKEKVFTLMRSLREDSDRYLKHSMSIPNTLDVGGRVWEYFLKGETIAIFLRGLNEGLTPKESSEIAKIESEEIVNNWNSKREYQVHRWVKMMHSPIDDILRRFETLIK